MCILAIFLEDLFLHFQTKMQKKSLDFLNESLCIYPFMETEWKYKVVLFHFFSY